MEPTIITAYESKQSQQSNWKKILLYVAVAVVAGAVSGGTVWYYMNQQDKDNKTTLNSQIDTKNKSITALQNKVATLEKTSISSDITNTNTGAKVTTNDLEVMKTFCSSSNTAGIVQFAYASTHSGIFGTCSLSNGYNIVKMISGNWVKIYEGNGMVEEATIDKYQIPQFIYPKQLVTLSTERTY